MTGLSGRKLARFDVGGGQRKSGAGSLRRASSLERRCRWWPDDTTLILRICCSHGVGGTGTDVEGSGGSANFVPAVISTDAMAQAPVSSQAVAVSFSGRMEIELPGGCRLVASNDVDTAVLATCSKYCWPMIPLPPGVRVWLATGYTDMRKASRRWRLRSRRRCGAIPERSPVLLPWSAR